MCECGLCVCVCGQNPSKLTLSFLAHLCACTCRRNQKSIHIDYARLMHRTHTHTILNKFDKFCTMQKCAHSKNHFNIKSERRRRRRRVQYCIITRKTLLVLAVLFVCVCVLDAYAQVGSEFINKYARGGVRLFIKPYNSSQHARPQRIM